MVWKTSSDVQLPVSVNCSAGTPRSVIHNSDASFRWNCQQRLPANAFESSVKSILEVELAEKWLASSSGLEPHLPATHLVALAAQACREATAASEAAAHCQDRVFTERLKSLQGDFICAEANLGNNHTGAPLLIMAIGQKALSWRQYAGQFPAPCAATSSVKGFGHFHPAVQAAAQKLPLQQLAWLLHDQKCRLLLCGHGPAGAVAQHAALVIQQHLRALLPGQADGSSLGHLLCITFGAPPSDLSDSTGVSLLSTCRETPSLFWNFLLADESTNMATSLLDIMPAVMSTVPKHSDAAMSWVEAVDNLLVDSQSRAASAAAELKDSLRDLTSAGAMLHPNYVGHTWFLSQDTCPTEAKRLREVFKLSNVDAKLVCRQDRADYWQVCRRLGDSLYQLDPLQPVGVLDGLKVGRNLRGFFTPLTPPAPSKAWYQRQAPLLNQPPPMVGCHITVQGDGVQWLHAENMRLELRGGVHGEVTFKLDPPQPARNAVQPELVGNSLAKQKLGRVQATSLQVSDEDEPLAADDPTQSPYHVTLGLAVQVRGNLDMTLAKLRILPPDRKVQVMLYIESPFERCKILLEIEQDEEDAGAKGQLASAPVEDQLQGAILYATCCLCSSKEEFQKLGNEVLESIDTLEQWCKADPADLGLSFRNILRSTYQSIEWSQRSTKDIVLSCCQEVGETASGGSTSYEKLYIVSHEWQANSKAIAAVLASPMLLEYKADTVDYVISGMLLGLTAASALVPVVIPAVAGVAVACYALRCVPALVTAAQLIFTWWGMRRLYLAAYMAKLKQIVSLVKPGSHPQQDLAILEDIIFKECTDAVAADSPFGRVLKGPEPRLSEGSKLPAALPVWQRVQLEKQKSFRLSNNRRLTTGCLQVFSVHLNRICAIHRLRKSIHDVCLVGCVGEENAGKTTLIRKLLGLPVIEGAHKIEKATACPDVLPMPIHGPGGLKAWSNSPLLVDTPGMFDQRQEFADCAIKHLGSMALHIMVLSATRSGRIDSTMHNRILEFVSDGKPTLICINQMSRYLDWWQTAEEVKQEVMVLQNGIIEKCKQERMPCGSVTVFFTDFAPEEAHRDAGPVVLQHVLDGMQKREFKSVEDVRDWICQNARGMGFDVPENLLDMADLDSCLHESGNSFDLMTHGDNLPGIVSAFQLQQ